MKKILIIVAVIVSMMAEAQVNGVSLKANGLTCSMCSNAIYKALKTLDFVLDVDADIKTYTFEITFRPERIIDFEMIRKKVVGAGFAISAFVANIHFDSVQLKSNEPVIILQDKTFLFINAKDELLIGNKQVKIIDKGFISPKESNKNTFEISAPQTYHVQL